MFLNDREVYVVGYRLSDIEPWETSGKTFGNLIDAQENAKAVNGASGAITAVFKMGRAMPVEENK